MEKNRRESERQAGWRLNCAQVYFRSSSGSVVSVCLTGLRLSSKSPSSKTRICRITIVPHIINSFKFLNCSKKIVLFWFLQMYIFKLKFPLLIPDQIPNLLGSADTAWQRYLIQCITSLENTVYHLLFWAKIKKNSVGIPRPRLVQRGVKDGLAAPALSAQSFC